MAKTLHWYFLSLYGNITYGDSVQEMKPNRIGRKECLARAFSEAISAHGIASGKALAMTSG